MKELLILRHAKSSWGNSRLADHDRPLNERGQEDAPRMGRLLRDEGLTPDLIITSSAERALTTAELAALHSDYEAGLQVTRALYHADPDEYLAQLRQVDEAHTRVMVVGHNPGMEALVEMLTGHYERMPTAALAHVSLSISRWERCREGISGQLLNLWRPREL
ncbi:MAG: histidine phosphatase family protein [Chloroflexota bacterium]|jgi:phosphohistidine phosphatase